MGLQCIRKANDKHRSITLIANTLISKQIATHIIISRQLAPNIACWRLPYIAAKFKSPTKRHAQKIQTHKILFSIL